MRKSLHLFIATVLLAAACSSTTSQPSSVDIATLAAAEQPAAADVLDDQEWHGIPIMSEAVNGQEDGREYSFTVNSSAEEIQAFYVKELALRGLSLSIPGGIFGQQEEVSGNDMVMVFTGNTSAFSIAIIPGENGSTVIITHMRGSAS